MGEIRGAGAPWLKSAAGAVWCVVLGWFFASGRQVPLLSLVDLGFHDLGHLVTYVLPRELVTAAMGSVAQVAVPLGLSAYFFFVRHQRVSAGVCLAWTATSAGGFTLTSPTRHMSDSS